MTSDPLSARDERHLVSHITATAGAYLAEVASAGFDRVVGSSGTILSLGVMAAQAASGRAPQDVRNLRVDARELHRLRKRLTSLPLADRLRLPGLEPRRADIAVAGAVLLDTLLRKLGAKDFTLSDLALREGLVLDYIRTHRPQIVQVDTIPDVRRRSVAELSERWRVGEAHAQQVARLSLSLFDQTREVHGLGAREREWLEYAALLHDVGVQISYERHHQHSCYLITNGDLRGFDPQEVEVLALVARYHRRGTPRKSQRPFGALPGKLRRTVRALAAILRLAEGLDRSHSQPLTSITLVDRGDDVLVTLGSVRRRGTGALGGRPPRRAAREAARKAGAVRGARLTCVDRPGLDTRVPVHLLRMTPERLDRALPMPKLLTRHPDRHHVRTVRHVERPDRGDARPAVHEPGAPRDARAGAARDTVPRRGAGRGDPRTGRIVCRRHRRRHGAPRRHRRPRRGRIGCGRWRHRLPHRVDDQELHRAGHPRGFATRGGCRSTMPPRSTSRSWRRCRSPRATRRR